MNDSPPAPVAPAVDVASAASRCCLHCGSPSRQVKNGHSRLGVAQFKCQDCGRCYRALYKTRGYSEEVRLQAVRLYLDGTNFRRIARHLGVNHQSVINWVNAYHARLKEQEPAFPHQNPAPCAAQTQVQDETTDTRSLEVVEGDEVFTFVGAKKTKSTS